MGDLTARAHLGALVATLALALSATAAAAQAYKPEYKLSTVLGKPYPWGIGAERWAELVHQRTQGRINIRVFPGASLVGGNQTSEFTALRQGAIDLAVGGTNNWSPQVRELSLFSLPFLMPEAKGVVPLAWGDNGFRELSNSKRAVRTPADLKGLKIRVVGSPILTDTFVALGANPTQMSWADAQSALSTGAVDGQETPVSIFANAKFQAMGQVHLTLWGYVASPLIYAVNRDVWNTWTPADREIVRAAAIDAARENVALARNEDPTLRQLAAEGVTITRLTAAERSAFRRAAQSVYDKWTPLIGPDLVKKAEAAIARR
jgi:TRAP-type C4-dicarboxylate transport system substrate-binding protein